ncbi:MAG: MotA/TolQ/ExbB proton channel family protein [Alphaproteobacteria bacterium]|nr:MotA/TolQ/ExbB proton channel family protein [Alphaproteobacteria bacterium]
MQTQALSLRSRLGKLPASKKMRQWWRRQAPARQDRYATLAPLLAVLLFLAAIVAAFGYLRLEEMEREQEAVRHDLEYAQQRLRLSLIERREELARRAQFLVRHLSRHIWVLELIAASAPLFGLLGTVLGMIVAFQGVGQGVGGADTALLAAGIWEALLTTAFGLGVALPFSILAAVFNNAVDGVRDMVEDALTEIVVRAEGRSAKAEG